MAVRTLPYRELLATGRARALALYRSHRLCRGALILGVLLLLFGLFGFFAAPPLIRSQLQTRLGSVLQRPVSVAAAHLNPFTLKLELDRLHIGERDGKLPFVDVDQVVVNASWSSLFRLAPVLDALTLQRPQLHITRTAPQQFNFSDLVERFVNAPTPPGASPARFSLSNIRVHNGDIVFDDTVLHSSHRIDQLELGVPFIANLPHDTDVFVQPLLALRVDGSPLRIDGRTKPFASSRESTLSFTLDHLDLPRYLGYAPVTLPVGVPRGQLSGQLQLRFVAAQPTPQLRLAGQLQLDNFTLAAHDGTPLLELGHAGAALDDVQPLLARYHLGGVQLDQAALHYTRTAGGHSNFDALTGAGPAATAATPVTDVRIATLTLQQARLDYADLSGHQPARLTFSNLHGSLRGLSTMAAPPGHIELAAQLAGGSLGINGQLDLAASRYDGKLNLKNVALAPLLPLAPPLLNATLTRGSLDADGQLQANWSNAFNLTMAPATVAINQLALSQRGRTPVAWQTLSAHIARVDLASHTAKIDRLGVRGLALDVQRQPNGDFDITRLLANPAPPRTGRHAAHPAAVSPAWRWSIAHASIDSSTLQLRDQAAVGQPTQITIQADKFGIDGLSDNLRRPLQVDLAGRSGRGTYHLTGQVQPQPLEADLHVKTTRLDIVPLQALVTVPLNVRITNALLSADGRVRYREQRPQPLMSYRGELTLGRVRVLDKLSNDDFLRWHALSASGLDMRLGTGTPHVAVAGLALSEFYARVIINPSGRLNLQDVVTGPAATPVSVTRAQRTPAAPTAPAQPAPTAPTAPPADIHIGGITLARGQLNYTDNFIKPNYSANVTQLDGKIGAFGTTAGNPPATLTLQGQLDDNAPINIDGSINPLAPMAFLDVKAKATGVELTHLSPYSGKYAGYPITSGRLTVDVNYLLDQGKLTADNHFFIEQLTFGDRIDGAGISHLPVKLAVALLKNAQGQIDLHIPVSGSLDDPQFSVGSLVWRAFANLIGRAVTSPFRLLASLGGGHQPDLGYVEFAPGSSVLDATAQSRLSQLVQLLADKPVLSLDITGRVDPEFDENGLRRVMVDDLVQQEMLADSKSNDRGSNDADTSATQLGPDIYYRYLRRAYKHAKFPKPRNLIGLAKSPPPEDMKKLLETHMPVDQAALRQLAERRANAVRQWLQGKVDTKRVSVAAPQLDAKGIDDKGKTTRADFGLH
jgi:uncharacterized protein involved in outer membrane biogenesis